MKLVVFLKNKKEVSISNGKYFLKQRYNGYKNIVVKTGKIKRSVPRTQIKDFIQTRYYSLCKQLIYKGANYAY